MPDTLSDSFKNTFGTPKSASELFNAGKSNPGYVPNTSDFSSDAQKQSFLSGLLSGSNSGS